MAGSQHLPKKISSTHSHTDLIFQTASFRTLAVKVVVLIKIQNFRSGRSPGEYLSCVFSNIILEELYLPSWKKNNLNTKIKLVKVTLLCQKRRALQSQRLENTVCKNSSETRSIFVGYRLIHLTGQGLGYFSGILQGP